MNKMPKKTHGSRTAILTEQEKIDLKSEKRINSKKLSKLYKKLDSRIESLIKDLKIIGKSSHLVTWRIVRMNTWEPSELASLHGLFNDVGGQLHLAVIRSHKKKNKRYFWLDRSPLGEPWPSVDERTLEKSYVLRKIRGKITEKTAETLLKAYEKRDLPETKNEAITEEEIKNKI